MSFKQIFIHNSQNILSGSMHKLESNKYFHCINIQVNLIKKNRRAYLFKIHNFIFNHLQSILIRYSSCVRSSERSYERK